MNGLACLCAIGSSSYLVGLTDEQQQVVWKHLGVIERAAASLQLDSSFVADQGFETLCRIVSTYDPARGTFYNYAYIILRHDFAKYQRSNKEVLYFHELEERKHSGKERVLSLDIDNKKNFNGQFTLNDLTTLEELRAEIGEYDWQILVEYYVHGDTLECIGLRRNLIRQSVHERIRKVLTRIGCKDATSKRVVVAIRKRRRDIEPNGGDPITFYPEGRRIKETKTQT